MGSVGRGEIRIFIKSRVHSSGDVKAYRPNIEGTGIGASRKSRFLINMWRTKKTDGCLDISASRRSRPPYGRVPAGEGGDCFGDDKAAEFLMGGTLPKKHVMPSGHRCPVTRFYCLQTFAEGSIRRRKCLVIVPVGKKALDSFHYFQGSYRHRHSFSRTRFSCHVDPP